MQDEFVTFYSCLLETDANTIFFHDASELNFPFKIDFGVVCQETNRKLEEQLSSDVQLAEVQRENEQLKELNERLSADCDKARKVSLFCKYLNKLSPCEIMQRKLVLAPFYILGCRVLSALC